MAEPWRLQGDQGDPIWITGSAFGGAAGAVVTEESFAASASTNSLLEYLTPFGVGQGFESASVVKSSAGKIYQILYSNPSGFPMFLQFFDRNSTPPNGLPPSGSYRVEASSSISLDFRSGRAFSTGIVVATSVQYSFFTGSASGSFQVFYK